MAISLEFENISQAERRRTLIVVKLVQEAFKGFRPEAIVYFLSVGLYAKAIEYEFSPEKAIQAVREVMKLEDNIAN